MEKRVRHSLTKFPAIKLYQRINKTVLNFHQFQNIKRSTLRCTGVVKRHDDKPPSPSVFLWMELNNISSIESVHCVIIFVTRCGALSGQKNTTRRNAKKKEEGRREGRGNKKKKKEKRSKKFNFPRLVRRIVSIRRGGKKKKKKKKLGYLNLGWRYFTKAA